MTWTPDSPNLYDVTIRMGQDTVSSYTGFRTVTREEVHGVQRIVLVCLGSVSLRISKAAEILDAYDNSLLSLLQMLH